jgi:signal transduction histidine kinase
VLIMHARLRRGEPDDRRTRDRRVEQGHGRRSNVPRLAADTETTAYFIAAEALSNVVKHAGASTTSVKLAINDAKLYIEVRDDGAGGADPSQGSGPTGLLNLILIF